MDIEKSIGLLKVFRNYNKFYKEENKNLTITITLETKESIDKAIERLLTAYEKSKGLEEKIKKYINIIQKELDKYKIKNTNTYLQIEGNPEISELLIQRATLEELIKEE